MKGMICRAKQYSSEYKLEAVKRFEKSGKVLKYVAEELGIKPTTMQGWFNKCRKHHFPAVVTLAQKIKLLFQHFSSLNFLLHDDSKNHSQYRLLDRKLLNSSIFIIPQNHKKTS